jgi:PPK2 family polyphosphate:nucleotide phosphotransferase
MTANHRIEPGRPIRLSNISTRGEDYYEGGKETAELEFKALRDEFVELQPRLYAEDKQKLLIVLQANDAGGKDSTIRKVTRGVNPQGVHVTSFKTPSQAELAHDFLWRVHKAVPAKGMIGIFNRSHYEDVLIVRVHNIVPENVWRPRYEHINQFEKLLTDSGTTILKFYLHISKEEQKERFQARLDDPTKHWKFSLEDLEKRKLWDDYMVAFEDMINRCTIEHAPWYVIPADQKWYRNLAITRIIVNTLKQMNPQYPQNEADLSNVVIT